MITIMIMGVEVGLVRGWEVGLVPRREVAQTGGEAGAQGEPPCVPKRFQHQRPEVIL